jgi:hypothetical protein
MSMWGFFSLNSARRKRDDSFPLESSVFHLSPFTFHLSPFAFCLTPAGPAAPVLVPISEVARCLQFRADLPLTVYAAPRLNSNCAAPDRSATRARIAGFVTHRWLAS